tara:strand:- start:711 stop:1328 length:618 start_codon:yes stop_codon:yes gene_type:complete
MSEYSNIILANGEFPRHEFAINILNNASTIICTDGSANNLINYGIKPDYIIGDLDSLHQHIKSNDENIIRVYDQNKNDLEKAIEYFLTNHSNKKLVILGATGQRDDQNLASLLLLDKYSKSLSISMITNYFKIVVNKGKNIYPSRPGQTISLLPLNMINKITTEGLEYDLLNHKLATNSLGVSNVALDDKFLIDSSENIFVFMEI